MLREIFSFDLEVLFSNLVLAAMAGLFAVPVALERERARRPAGLRTFPVVGLASCAFVIIGIQAFPHNADAQARIVQGLITGIGFIGGGAILKDTGEDGTVMGIATAASIWATGAMGAAIAYGRMELAVALVLINLAVLRWAKPFIGSPDGPREPPDGEAEDE